MGKYTHWRWNPEETSKPCTSERQESTLTGEWNPDEAAKARTSDTRNSEFPGEWNPDETRSHVPLKHGEVNSLVNETLKKSLKCVPQTHGKVYSLEMKPWVNQYGAPQKHTKTELTGEWNPKETTKPCTSDTGETELTAEWNPDETTKPRTSDRWKVNSQVNETLKNY